MAMMLCERGAFDVVVLDTRLPNFGTSDMFTYFYRQYPQTIRLAFVPEGHREEVHREALAYQSVVRTAGVDEISAMIERAAELHERLSDPKLQQMLKRVEVLPSPPHIVSRLNAALNRHNASINEVSEIISQDIAIPARLLQVVNSAYFSLARTMTNVREAVAYLGFDAVRNLIVTLEMFREMGHPTSPAFVDQVERLQMHSADVANLTRDFISDRQQAHDAFVGSLIHDVGHLVMASYFEGEYVELQDAVSGGASLAETERNMFGVTHGDLGAQLMCQWGLPYRLIDSVAFHHDAPRFASTGIDPVHGVFIAEHLVAEQNRDRPYWADAGLEPMEDEYLGELGVYERIMTWRAINVGFHRAS